MNNRYYYIGPNPTVDLILINHLQEILLIKRSSTVDTCPNMWAFPGGFIDSEATKHSKWKAGLESAEEAAIRELKEETCLDLTNKLPTFFGIYQGNNRDPRDNDISFSQSHVFFYHLSEQDFNFHKESIQKQEETDDVQWIPFKEALNMQLAFDHSKILQDYNKSVNKPKFNI